MGWATLSRSSPVNGGGFYKPIRLLAVPVLFAAALFGGNALRAAGGAMTRL